MDVVHTTNLVPTTIINHSFKSLSPALREASTSASKSISTSTSSYNTPRGVIDIIATRATASVLPVGSYMNIHSHHSNAAPPTPFNLAIMVRAEIKWILCFETAKELMVWLNAFADTALEESAEQYKKKLGRSYEYEESRNFEAIDSVNTDTCKIQIRVSIIRFKVFNLRVDKTTPLPVGEFWSEIVVSIVLWTNISLLVQPRSLPKGDMNQQHQLHA